MCFQNNKCNTWISLQSVGIPAEGCVKDLSWVPPFHSSQMGHAYINLPNKRLLCTDVIAHGQFGQIDVGLYQTDKEKKEVYVKKPILTESLLYEACIQKLVGESLAAIGFPLGAPPLVSIFSLYNGSVCFAMEPIPGAVTLDRFLQAATIHEMAGIVIDCLLQLCGMLSHLHSHLGMNHRDLKPSNFLIREHEPLLKRFIVDGESMEIQSRYSLTIIDFGFACIGSGDKTDVSLSTVYSVTDRCPKEGRDLFLFLGLLYLDFHAKLPPTLRELFEVWTNPSICAFMRKNKEYSMQWLYFMAGNERIQRFPCTPSRIVRDLMML